jgi:hypothetical protein
MWWASPNVGSQAMKTKSDQLYAHQQLYEAVLSLIGAGPIQQRLTFAAEALVQLRAPQPNVVPAKISAQFQAVVDALTKTPLRDGSGYAPRQVTPEEGEKLAGQILSMFVDVQGDLQARDHG